MTIHSALRNEVNFAAQKLLQIQPETDDIQQAASRLDVDEEIDITVLLGFATSNRAKYAHVPRASG